MKAAIGSISPEWAKKIFRLLRYGNERKKLLREPGIRREQNRLLPLQYRGNGSRLVVFIVPGTDWFTGRDKITGGTMSIVSLCEESAALLQEGGTQTIMCTMHHDHLLLRHTMFENNTWVYRFNQLPGFFTSLQHITIHLPELMTAGFLNGLTQKDHAWLQKIPHLHVNIMNQNIRLMPGKEVIEKARQLFPELTITTAHQRYCTPFYRQHFGVPLHKLSVWISPEQYQYRRFAEKENLLVVSPDEHPEKEAILNELAGIPGLAVQIIRNLTYSQYKELAARARWTLTFGEGLDGYLIEPVFSGAIGFAVYNEEFFTPDFSELETIYPSATAMKERMVADLQRLNNEAAFEPCQQAQYKLCARYYNKEQYRKNIAAFYRAEYTYA